MATCFPISPRRTVLLTALALSLSLPLGTAFAATTDAQFQSAFQTFQAAQKGDSAAVERAADQFHDLLKADPGQPMLMAYAGAATALKAKSSYLPWKKIGHAENGLAMIDKALALLQPTHDTAVLNRSPVSLQTRFTAASSFLAMPSFFNRGARGAKLLAEVQASPLLAQASPGFQGAVLMSAAQLAAKEFRTADARRDLGAVISRGLPQAEAANAQLLSLPQ
ncbi:MAG: hypothetical protein H7Y33_16135 [Cytophagales bacterium]|nr:hypothetical protein [Rhizobacter sp.]